MYNVCTSLTSKGVSTCTTYIHTYICSSKLPCNLEEERKKCFDFLSYSVFDDMYIYGTRSFVSHAGCQNGHDTGKKERTFRNKRQGNN